MPDARCIFCSRIINYPDFSAGYRRVSCAYDWRTRCKIGSECSHKVVIWDVIKAIVFVHPYELCLRGCTVIDSNTKIEDFIKMYYDLFYTPSTSLSDQ